MSTYSKANIIISLFFLILNPLLYTQQTRIRKSFYEEFLPGERKVSNLEKSKNQISLKTQLGDLIGYEQQVENKTINVFYGIPYSTEPPVGRLRFKKAKLIERFPNNHYEALEYKPHCEQIRAKKYGPNELFSEDCLYMNIFTPSLKSNKVDGLCKRKFPVMFYIYGGKSSIYQKSKLVDNGPLAYSGELFAAVEDTILVIFNYRQELFASLYVEGQFNGNLALWDQNLALQFTKKYISDFCGDDKTITAFGNSLGSHALGLHLISEHSKYLISNAIMQSYAPLFRGVYPISKNELMVSSFLAINDLKCLNLNDLKIKKLMNSLDKNVRDKFFEFIDKKEFLKSKYLSLEMEKNWENFLAKLKERVDNLNRDERMDEDILKLIRYLSKNAIDVDCLLDLPSERIVESSLIYTDSMWSYYFDFDFIDIEAYLDYEFFDELNLNPKLNLLIGAVNDEECTTRFSLKDIYSTDQFNAPAIPKEDAKKIIKSSSLLVTDKKGFSQVMADYYTDESRWKLDDGYSEAISNALGDQQFYCPIHFFAQSAALSGANSVSTYIVSQAPTKHFSSYISDYDLTTYNWLGACHADELNFLFGAPIRMPDQFSDADRQFSFKLLALWTEFAKNGKMSSLNPSGKEWPISKKHSSEPRYVEINNRFTREFNFEFERRCNLFWKPLLPFYKK